MDGGLLQLALREMRAVVTSPLSQVGMAIAVLVLTVSGPFGTFVDLDAAQRFAYWALVVVTTYVLGSGVIAALAQWLTPRIGPLWPRLVVAALLGSLPITAAVALANLAFYRTVSPPNVLVLAFYVAVIAVAVTVIASLAGRQLGGARGGTGALQTAAPVTVSRPATAAEATPPILDRVPAGQRGQLLALIVQDHYVDIVTSRGKTLVLMRLADAIREAAPVEGLQIHRSHWVARDAVVGSSRDGGKTYLDLSNGMTLPVSRGALPAVREAGWAK